MRGSIRKRGSTYTYWLDMPPDPVTGKRRQRTKGGFRTKRECQAALNEAIMAVQTGTYVEASRRTVRSFLLDEWLPDREPPKLRATTYANYQTQIKTHVVPGLGSVELQRLSPAQLNAFYRALLADGRRDGQGLAPKTVKNIHAILHRALKDAVRWGYVVRNVADAVEPPKGALSRDAGLDTRAAPGLPHACSDGSAVCRLAASGHDGHASWELAGLRWVDVDLEARRASPRRPRVVVNYAVEVSEPKTAKGRRSVALDALTVAALREHKEREAEDQAVVGPGWQDSGLVFTRPDGAPIHPDLHLRLVRAAGS